MVEELVSRMQKHGLDVWFYTRDQWFVPRLSGPQVRQRTESLRCGPQRYLNLAEVSDLILKVSGISERPTNPAACESELRQEFAGRVCAVLSPPHDLDVTHPSADKGQAAIAIAMTEGALMEEGPRSEIHARILQCFR
jgi:hydroxymethylpyrimidine pyrophosphatase-like HAD family hydrolase